MKTPSTRSALIVALLGFASSLALGATETNNSNSSANGLELSIGSSFSHSGKTGLEGSGKDRGALSMNDSSVAVGATILDSFSIGLDYSRHDLKFKGSNSSGLPSSLRSLSLNLGYSMGLTENSSGMIVLSPCFNTAGSTPTFNKEGFGLTGALLYQHRFNERLSGSLGVAYDSLATGTLHVFPLLGVEWNPDDRWGFCLGIPETSISYKLTDTLRLALKAEGKGGTFYLEKDTLHNDGSRPVLNDSMIEYYDVRLGLCLTWNMGPGQNVSLSAGSMTHREFDFEARNYKLKSRGSSGYAELAVNFSF